MKYASKAQIAQIKEHIAQLDLTEHTATLVNDASNGRAFTPKDLKSYEAVNMISTLEWQIKVQKRKAAGK